MTKLGLILIVVLICSGVVPATGSAEEFPASLQAKLLVVMGKQAVEKLGMVYEQYRGTKTCCSGLAPVLKNFGLSSQEIRLVTERYSSEGENSANIGARWQDDTITLEDSGNRVEASAVDLWRQSIRINGKRFAWNLRKTAAENLARYEGLFTQQKHSRLDFRTLGLISTALAADGEGQLFRLKASGLQLYFLVSSLGEIGGELYSLNDKVKQMLALCKSPEPKPGEDDPFLRAVLLGTADSQSYQGEIVKLRKCSDLKALTRDPVRVLNGEPVYSRLPADLCRNMNSLAVCVHEQMEPATVSDGKLKKPKDKEEWYEQPSKPAPAGAQRAK